LVLPDDLLEARVIDRLVLEKLGGKLLEQRAILLENGACTAPRIFEQRADVFVDLP
jgi:hypothetical protein